MLTSALSTPNKTRMLQLKNLSENLQRNLLNILPVTDVQYSLQLADTVGAKKTVR